MKKFEILEHKADLKIRIFGVDKEELFFNAILAIRENQRAIISMKDARRKIKVSSPDLPSLLIDFLSQVLYLSQVNKENYNNIKFKKLTNIRLEAEISGKKVEIFGEEIKGATYHGLDIHQEKDGTWQATVLFDV